MQSERGQGFLLIAPAVYPEDEYQELKASIEKICRKAEKICIESNVDNLNFALLAREEIFITVSVREKNAQFALYDKGNNKLIQECTIYEYKRNVNQFRLDLLEYRIENECRAVANGHVLSRENLDAAWMEKYRDEELNSEMSLVAKRGKGR